MRPEFAGGTSPIIDLFQNLFVPPHLRFESAYAP
jgi:hypothetical protein